MDLKGAPIANMEQAIRDRLRIGFPSHPFQLERVPLVLTVKEFERVARLTPFLGLAWAGFTPDGDTNGRITKGDWAWRLILVFKASSSLETRFKGDKKDIGLDAMIDVATLLLNGAVFENIGTCQVTRASAVYAEGWSDETTVIAQIDFTVKFSAMPRALKFRTADDLIALGVTWLVEPEVDGAPEPTETIQLPQDP